MESLPSEILFNLTTCPLHGCGGELRRAQEGGLLDLPEVTIEMECVKCGSAGSHGKNKSILGHLLILRAPYVKWSCGRGIEYCVEQFMALTMKMRLVSKRIKTLFDGYAWRNTFFRLYSLSWLSKACRLGQIDSVKQIISIFCVKVVDAGPLAAACAQGHLDVAKWLVDTFSPHGRDVRIHNSEALCNACKLGRTDVVQWLAHTFQLDWSPKCARIAGRARHYDLAEWIETEWRKKTRERQEEIRERQRTLAAPIIGHKR
jgi:hypothetical protein